MIQREKKDVVKPKKHPFDDYDDESFTTDSETSTDILTPPSTIQDNGKWTISQPVDIHGTWAENGRGGSIGVELAEDPSSLTHLVAMHDVKTASVSELSRALFVKLDC